MRAALVLALLTGCSFRLNAGAGDGGVDGRIDSSIDASDDIDGDGVPNTLDNCPTMPNADQRDHDVDGRGDVCDLCPHIAEGSDVDTDGDGVGDACDPRPLLPGDHRALWTGFYDASDITGWPVNGTDMVTNGRLVIGSTTMGFQYTFPPGMYQNAYAVAGVRLQALGSTAFSPGFQTQNGNNAVSEAYQCNLITGNTGPHVDAYDFWPGQSPQTDSVAWSGTFAVGNDFLFEDKVSGSTHTCSYTQGAATAKPTQTAGPHAGYLILGAQYATAGYDYLFIVEIGQ